MSLGIDRTKNVVHDEVDSEGSWAISYGDMVTLLLAFFVLFFTVDPAVEKEEQLKDSLITALEGDSKTIEQRSPASEQKDSDKEQEMDLGQEKQEQNIDQNIMKQWGARVYTVGKRIIIDFPRSNFFGLGQVTLNEEGQKLLDDFIEKYTPYAGHYVLGVRAYTDARPVRSAGYRYKDNLELSALRAISTMRYLQDKGIPLDRMRLGGYGILKKTDEELLEIKEKYNIEDPMAFSRKVVLVIEPEAKKGEVHMKKFLMLFLIIFNVIFTHAEDKHPRVAELEDKFKSDAMDYLEARFPGLPFSVSVSIDPLRRSFGSNYNIKGEKLPFYALEEEEIQDEWDDPTVTLYSLSNRVKKIKLTIQVPSGIKDEELADIKTNLSQILRLIPARDDIEVVKREWNVFPKLKWYLAIGLSSIFALLMGLFFISYISVRRVTKSLESIQANTTSGSGMGNMPASMPNIDLDKMTSKSQGPSGDIKFNDPIKIREVLDTRVAELVANKKDILRLENLILFDKFAQENPRAFGSLFLLFPTELKRMLFAYSNGKHWMEALTEPGEMNMKCLEIMEELGHVKTTDFREFWEKLLIQVWRLDSDFNAVSFLKIIDMQSSLTILAGMPKFISLRLGREVFPGNWATLLDSTYKFKKLSEKECEELYKQSLEMKPLAKLEDLDVFKKDRELIKFLKTADIRTEKEVYSAVPKDSMLHMLRPPFYVVFEQEDVVLKKLVQQYSIMEWAVALFNVPRDQRFKIENLFDEKEKIFYLEMLKGLDKNRPDPNKQGELRSRIANDVTMVVQNLIDYEVGAIVDAQGTDDEAA